MAYIVPAVIVAIAIVVTGLIVRHTVARASSGKPNGEALSLLQNQIQASIQQTLQQVETLRSALNESMEALTTRVSRGLNDTNRAVGDRLDNTAKMMGDVREKLGELEKSSRRMIELGEDISNLEQILRPPKLRGSLGELFLSDLLAQVLPANHYELQHHFLGGETVDAVVRLRTGMVPIDAKFPLDNFKRIVAADTEDDRKAAKKAFVRDVKGHIDMIAEKYIRMDENTFDFALMYVPAENVYYETIIKDEAFGGEMSLYSYALGKRVVPVSPNSFYAYLQTIVLGLKGMRVEERSREIVENLSRLQKEFETFAEAFRLVGQHLDNSTKKYAEAQRRFGKVESKVEEIDGLAKGLESVDGGAVVRPAEAEESRASA
jgi:DNA recombination protein RmuC